MLLSRWQTLGLAAISLFAFMATTKPAFIQRFDETFVFEGSRPELSARLKENGIELYEGTIYDHRAPQDSWALQVPLPFFCLSGPAEAAVTIAEKGSRTTVRLHGMAHYCRWYRGEEEKLLKVFVSKVAEPVGMVRQSR